MITRFQSAPLPVSPRSLRSRSGSVIQFGHPGGHVHTEKCNQGQCTQSKPKEGQAEERQFCLMPIFEKVKAFFQDIWNQIKEWWSPSSKKQTAPPVEKAAPKTEPKEEPHQEPHTPLDDHKHCQTCGEGSPPPAVQSPHKHSQACGDMGHSHDHGHSHSHGH